MNVSVQTNSEHFCFSRSNSNQLSDRVISSPQSRQFKDSVERLAITSRGFPELLDHSYSSFDLHGNNNDLLQVMPQPFEVEETKFNGLLSVRFTTETIQKLMMDCVCIHQNDVLWNGFNHLFYEGLIINNNGKVSIGMYSAVTECKDILPTISNPLLYYDVLKRVKKEYKHLRIIWSLKVPNPDLLFDRDGDVFWKSLDQLMIEHGLDGVELDLTNMKYISDKFLWGLRGFANRGKLWLRLTNNIDKMNAYDKSLLEEIIDEVNYIIIDSFGFFKYSSRLCNQQDVHILTQAKECSLIDFEKFLRRYELPKSKVIMGCSTTAVLLTCDPLSYDVCINVEQLAYCHVAHMRALAQFQCDNESAFSKTYLKRCSTFDETMDEANTLVSYDDSVEFEKKLKYVVNNNMAGLILGDYGSDLNCRHPMGLLHRASKYLNISV